MTLHRSVRCLYRKRGLSWPTFRRGASRVSGSTCAAARSRARAHGPSRPMTTTARASSRGTSSRATMATSSSTGSTSRCWGRSMATSGRMVAISRKRSSWTNALTTRSAPPCRPSSAARPAAGRSASASWCRDRTWVSPSHPSSWRSRPIFRPGGRRFQPTASRLRPKR